MVDQTPRLGLDDYDPGDTDWDHSDLVQFVEENAVQRDTFANRPNSGEYDGEPFLATDRRILYQWDATNSEWNPVAGMGTSSNPLPGEVHREAVIAETTTITDNRVIYAHGSNGNFEEPFPIADYADAGAALQAAHDALPSADPNSGGTIELPRGNLSMDTQPTITTSSVHLVGQATRATVLVNPRTDGTPCIQIDGALNTKFEDLTVKGSGTNGAGDVGVLIKNVSSSQYFTKFENVRFYDADQHNLHADDPGGGQSSFDIQIRDCQSGKTYSGHGIFIDSVSQVRISGGYFENAELNNLRLKTCSDVELNGVTVGDSENDVSLFSDSRDLTIGNLHVENGNGDGAKFGGEGISIGTIHCFGQGGIGVSFSNANNVVVDHIKEEGSAGAGVTVSGSCADITFHYIRNENSVVINSGATDIDYNGVDSFPNVSDGDSDGQITQDLDIEYTQKPQIAFGQRNTGIDSVTWKDTSGNGNIDQVVLGLASAGSTVDFYVSPTTDG